MFVPIIMGKRGITDLKHYITIKKNFQTPKLFTILFC